MKVALEKYLLVSWEFVDGEWVVVGTKVVDRLWAEE